MITEKTGQVADDLAHRRRVLCVDDAASALARRARILEMNGYEVTTSSSPLHAAERLECGKFDLAILDYEMPVVNGSQLAARLKMANPGLKIILYTGAGPLGEDKMRFIDEIVDKTLGIPALLAAIEGLLHCAGQGVDQEARHTSVRATA